MKNLFDSIYARWVATMGAIPLYNTEANPDTAYPYGTFSLVSAVSDLEDFTETWENCLIQFNLFDDDPKCTDINAAYALLKTAFHKFDLLVADADVISLTKEIANLLRVEKIWQYNCLFRITIQEN